MLDQLPAAQREQALDALRQLNKVGDSGARLDDQSEPDAHEIDREIAETVDQAAVDVPPRAGPHTGLIVNLILRGDLSRDEQESFNQDRALQQIAGSHYYELDEQGVLNFPGVSSVALTGLTADQISQRLGAEPALRLFEIDAELLDTAVPAREQLQPYGYEIFETGHGFDPVSSGPVPPDYVLGPGDSVRVQLFGNVNGIYEFEITRDGVLNLPDLGPITVAGLPFSEFREDLNHRVKEMLIGTQVSVSMGQLRTIRVFVLGDANRPGSYVVSSLATISSALYQSGGISRIGSLRDISLKRNGRTIARLDLYDLLLNGNTANDRRLQSGDVVFIAPVGPQAGVSGAVKRPAIYETIGKPTVSDLIRIAGGLKPDAYSAGARIERIEAGKGRVTIGVNAAGGAAKTMEVLPGDVLTVPKLLPRLEYTVTLAGHVERPGPYQWRNRMRLTDLLASLADLKPDADSDYVLVRRENPRDQSISVISADLRAALDSPASAANIELTPRDTIHVFSLAYGRQRVIEPILDELKLRARFGEPFREVSVTGRVRAPGTYPLESDMRVSDLIRAGGNLGEQAYALKAELARYEIVDGTQRNTEVIPVDLDSIIAGDMAADITLRPHDNLRISTLPDWDSLWTVSLEGEVRFPGLYRIRRGETLRDVLERAGGLTNQAFAEGAIFLRDSLREREQEQIEILARRLEADLTSMSLVDDQPASSGALQTGRSLLAQLRGTEAVGRLVIDLPAIVRGGLSGRQPANIELRDGDRLLIPKLAQEVTVIGETQQNTSHLYRPELSRNDYIEMSGGLTRRADRKLIYVVRASGAVETGRRSRWFGRKGSAAIRPGDTIVVPLETDRVRPLTLWTNITQILYQAAIAIAAVQTFDN